jgi:hypothetical protein
VYCVGCGEELRSDATACARCGSRAIGAFFSERVVVRHGDPIRTPTVCCCCLSPADTDFKETHSESGYGGRRTLTVPMPWCDACLGVRRRTGWIAVLSAVATHALVFAVLSRFVSDGSIAFVIGFCVGLVAAFAVPVAVRPLRASSKCPGHVAGCSAVSASVGRRQATLTFHNRAFAQIWRELQAGRVPTGPALEWTRPKPLAAGAASAPRPVELAGARQKNMAAEAQSRAREAASHEARVASRPVRGVVVAAPKSGADTAASVLRFVAKTCTFDEAGIVARYEDGHERRVLFADLSEIVLRQLPPGAPFAATIVLDLAPRDGSAPVRLLPSTRANYGALPGHGVTSQENFRRLASHLVARCAATRIEDASLPFVREAKAPPRVESIQQFLDYDARYP